MSARQSANNPMLFDTGPPEKFPWLSRQLKGPKVPDQCQSCGQYADLSRWREHDDNDMPADIVVVLCDVCAKKLVGPHPRLYSELDRNEPFPGTMTICLDCGHRDGLRCPQAKANGGPGVELVGPQPSRVFFDGSPRSNRGVLFLWPGPVKSCSARVVGRQGISIVDEEGHREPTHDRDKT